MKKVIGIIAATALLLFLGINLGGTANTSTSYLRLHIRAHSNLASDQNIKYTVRDAITDYLTPLVLETRSFAECREVIRKNLRGVEAVADRVLKNAGKNYTSRARVAEADFPTVNYDGFILERGIYDALIVYLGNGAGDNWWCVIYPPLCFVNARGIDSDGITYRSRIADMIRRLRSE
jgi:stage II sporulation protein R